MKNDDDRITSSNVQEKRKKKPSSLMKKLKLRARRNSVAEEVRTSSSEERRTPEGDEHLKSASETNLTEVSWKSADNLTEESSVKSVISAEVTERTKSLENLKSMPPFGELIVDEQEAMVKKVFASCN